MATAQELMRSQEDYMSNNLPTQDDTPLTGGGSGGGSSTDKPKWWETALGGIGTWLPGVIEIFNPKTGETIIVQPAPPQKTAIDKNTIFIVVGALIVLIVALKLIK